MTADEALREESNPTGDERHTALDDAIAWLQDALADGPLASEELFARAKADGFAHKTLERAKKQLGIRPWRTGQGKEMAWFWELPAGACNPTEQADPPAREPATACLC